MKACKRSIVLMKFRDHLAKNLSESGINCLDMLKSPDSMLQYYDGATEVSVYLH